MLLQNSQFMFGLHQQVLLLCQVEAVRIELHLRQVPLFDNPLRPVETPPCGFNLILMFIDFFEGQLLLLGKRPFEVVHGGKFCRFDCQLALGLIQLILCFNQGQILLSIVPFDCQAGLRMFVLVQVLLQLGGVQLDEDLARIHATAMLHNRIN